MSDDCKTEFTSQKNFQMKIAFCDKVHSGHRRKRPQKTPTIKQDDSEKKAYRRHW